MNARRFADYVSQRNVLNRGLWSCQTSGLLTANPTALHPISASLVQRCAQLYKWWGDSKDAMVWVTQIETAQTTTKKMCKIASYQALKHKILSLDEIKYGTLFLNNRGQLQLKVTARYRFATITPVSLSHEKRWNIVINHKFLSPDLMTLTFIFYLFLFFSFCTTFIVASWLQNAK